MRRKGVRPLGLWGWTTSQKQWSLEDEPFAALRTRVEDLLEVTASINPSGAATAQGTAVRRPEVVTQPWAAARAPPAKVSSGWRFASTAISLNHLEH